MYHAKNQKRKEAAEEGKPLTKWCPGWLRLNGDKYEPITKCVAVVRRIFDLTLEGHGKAAIARKLNSENVPTFAGILRQVPKLQGWYPSYIHKILRNEAVIGRFQPYYRKYENGKFKHVRDGDPIDGYFPTIIDRDKFLRVQQTKGASGYKAHPLSNILSGMVFCHFCGGILHYINKGGARGGYYLGCDNARRKETCKAKPVRHRRSRILGKGFADDR